MQTETSISPAPQPAHKDHAPHHALIASDRIEGTPVRRSNGRKIGTIQRIMIDKLSGRVAYAVLNFGGFLGVGTQHLPVPWSLIKFNPKLEAYELNLTDDELAKAPSYAADEEFDWGDRSAEIALRNYYRMPRYWGV
ncbi:MAG TPA: PRC-barrel domain-containing protein [Pseudolabrys sp.]|nr:PRC-barrel domain-containing protein [Pseudolabrys sp.]